MAKRGARDEFYAAREPFVRAGFTRSTYRPGDTVIATVDIDNSRGGRGWGNRGGIGLENRGSYDEQQSLSEVMVVESVRVELMGVERLDPTWIQVPKVAGGSKKTRGERIILDSTPTCIASQAIIERHRCRSYAIRAVLPPVLPPSYRGTAARYSYHLAVTVEWSITRQQEPQTLAADRRSRSSRSLTEDSSAQGPPPIELKVPLRVCSLPDASGLTEEEREAGGIVPITPPEVEIQWRERNTGQAARWLTPADLEMAEEDDDDEDSRSDASGHSSHHVPPLFPSASPSSGSLIPNHHSSAGSSSSAAAATAAVAAARLPLLSAGPLLDPAAAAVAGAAAAGEGASEPAGGSRSRITATATVEEEEGEERNGEGANDMEGVAGGSLGGAVGSGRGGGVEEESGGGGSSVSPLLLPVGLQPEISIPRTQTTPPRLSENGVLSGLDNRFQSMALSDHGDSAPAARTYRAWARTSSLLEMEAGGADMASAVASSSSSLSSPLPNSTSSSNAAAAAIPASASVLRPLRSPSFPFPASPLAPSQLWASSADGSSGQSEWSSLTAGRLNRTGSGSSSGGGGSGRGGRQGVGRRAGEGGGGDLGEEGRLYPRQDSEEGAQTPVPLTPSMLLPPTRSRTYNIRIDDQILVRFTPRNPQPTFFLGDAVAGTLSFPQDGGNRRCLEVSIILETAEVIQPSALHRSRRAAAAAVAAKSPLHLPVSQMEHHEVTADIIESNFIFTIPFDAPASFATPIFALQWLLRFEFVSSCASPSHPDLHPLSESVPKERVEWSMPITVHAPLPRCSDAFPGGNGMSHISSSGLSSKIFYAAPDTSLSLPQTPTASMR